MVDLKNEYKNKLYQEEVARAIQEMFALGYFPYEGFGEVSARDADSGRVYISMQPGGFHLRNPGDYHGCDTVVIGPDGKPMTEYTKPSPALSLHLAIYKARPDVNAIIHTKGEWTGHFADKGKGIPFILEEQYDLMGTTKCVTAAPSDTPDYNAAVVAALGEEKRTVIMKDNGVISVADNVDRAVNYLAWVEAVARKAIRASMIGKVNVVTSDNPMMQL